MQSLKPDPRFQTFQEQFNQDGQAIGFRIPNNPFLFQYDDFGGWKDQKGNYYNKDGILQQSDHSNHQQSEKDQDQDDIDDQIVDQFEQMLMQEEQGIIRKQKSTKQKKQISTANNQALKNQDYAELAKQYIQKLQKKQSVREGLTTQLFIYFKMKSSYFQRVKPQSQKKQDMKSRNEFVQKQIKQKLQQKKKQLIENNKTWLNGNFLLESSGISFEQGLYDRYWYGWVKVSHQKYFQTINELKKSKQFAILKSKTYYALISKFYLKKKMQAQIQQLQAQLKDVAQTTPVKIAFNNLPQQFPLSLIFDFVEYSQGSLEDIIDVNILDNFAAQIVVRKKTAQKIMNIQGYCHDEKQYVWLEVIPIDSSKVYPTYKNNFNIQIDADFKLPYAQLCDTMGLIQSKDQILKFGAKDDQFRLVISQSVLKRVLMFRGESLNIVRVLRFEKKQ